MKIQGGEGEGSTRKRLEFYVSLKIISLIQRRSEIRSRGKSHIAWKSVWYVMKANLLEWLVPDQPIVIHVLMTVSARE